MNAHGSIVILRAPGRTYFAISVGSTCVSNCWQYGHWGSMNSTIVTGADGRPSVVPLWGIPLKSAFTSAASGSPPVREPTAGVPASDGDDEPRPSTIASTTATTAATTTAPPAASTRGEA